LEKPVEEVLAAMAEQGIQAGFSLKNDYPKLGNGLLICVTDTKTDDDLMAYENALRSIQ
ncbi:MAG: glycine dehydrogenase, partial [Coxiella burnetii]|nr:glycine dehydrogenase [Coxiella burnetii]